MAFYSFPFQGDYRLGTPASTIDTLSWSVFISLCVITVTIDNRSVRGVAKYGERIVYSVHFGIFSLACVAICSRLVETIRYSSRLAICRENVPALFYMDLGERDFMRENWEGEILWYEESVIGGMR